VAEGALQYLPFSALPEPGKPVPLTIEHEVVTAPSASVLAVLRQETATRQPAERLLFVAAEPVYSEKDAGLRRHRIQAVAFKESESPESRIPAPHTVTKPP